MCNVPVGCEAKPGTMAEPYTNTGWAKEVVHRNTGIELVYIPAGEFLMGSPGGEAGRESGEVQHKVAISNGFYMGKYAVTQAQWKKVMGANPPTSQGVDYPAVAVSWSDSRGFCDRAGFRLPTEAEWEYACRAGTTGAYGGTGRLDEMGWFGNNGKNRMHPVGQKQPNAWGLYDMHGNAWEWCSDWYGAYPTGDVTDPPGATSGVDHVIRGGCWGRPASESRSAFRIGYDSVNPSGLTVGLRVVLSMG